MLVISDGNDTSSEISVQLLRQRIRDSEVLVYALGVDGTVRASRRGATQPPIGLPIPNPFPWPRTRGQTRPAAAHHRRRERRALEPSARRAGERRGAAPADRRHRRPHGDRARFRRIWRAPPRAWPTS